MAFNLVVLALDCLNFFLKKKRKKKKKKKI